MYLPDSFIRPGSSAVKSTNFQRRLEPRKAVRGRSIAQIFLEPRDHIRRGRDRKIGHRSIHPTSGKGTVAGFFQLPSR